MSGALSVFAMDRAQRRRIGAGVLVVLVHLVPVAVLLTGGGGIVRPVESEPLALFDILPPPPLPVPAPSAPTPAPVQAPAPAAPPNLAAVPVAIAVPPPIIVPPPPPIVVAPVPSTGQDRSAGASDRASPATGAGGIGTGLGSGGTGIGGGGGGSEARLIRGGIYDRDYPRAARRAEIEGTVIGEVTIGTNGRVRDCQVTRSSGSAELDETTCRLIVKRFRYAPARDARGEPVEEIRSWRQVWWLEPLPDEPSR